MTLKVDLMPPRRGLLASIDRILQRVMEDRLVVSGVVGLLIGLLTRIVIDLVVEMCR